MSASQSQYTWHLRPPFRRMFNASHWWKGRADVEPEAAAYELARRHPRVQEGYKLPGRTNPTVFLAPIACLRDIGLKPWPRLKEQEKASWRQCMASFKGVDMRPDSAKCYSVTRLALQIAHVSTTGDTRLDNLKLPTPGMADKFVRIASAIAESEGYLLIAVAPDLTQEKAEALLAGQYRRHRKESGAKPRERSGNWLDLIAAFEDSVASPPKGAEAVTAANETSRRYRRVMKSIAFGRSHLAGCRIAGTLKPRN